MKSLRRSLLLRSLPLIVAVALGAAAIGYYGSRHEAEEIFDTQMAEYARLLATALPRSAEAARRASPGDDGITDTLAGSETEVVHEYETRLTFQYWIAGQRVARSRFAPTFGGAAREGGFHRLEYDGRTWRVFTLAPSNDRRIIIAEDEYVRNELAFALATEALLPVLISVPILGLLLSLVVNLAIRSIDTIAEDVSTRSPTDLSPVATREAPRELGRLLESINGLLERLRAGLEREKQFSADAAHELRTPLTGIRIHLQNALLDAPTDTDLRRALEQAETGVHRMSHIVEQLLRFNRAINDEERIGTASVDLETVLGEVLETHHPVVRQRHQQLITRLNPATVHGNHDLLIIVFANLLTNASQYTPEGGRIAITTHVAENGVVVDIEDSGPGIPEAERGHALSRFHRGSDVSGYDNSDGCGLGLAIAERIFERHGARLTLGSSDTLGGLRVTVSFPLTT
jgi:two-component system sensor histidine kinase QseC